MCAMKLNDPSELIGQFVSLKLYCMKGKYGQIETFSKTNYSLAFKFNVGT